MLFMNNSVLADVVKPALVEIIVTKDRQVTIEVRASVEALLTGINSQYKNTQEAPTAAEYDVLRNFPASKLMDEFEGFKALFLASLYLKVDNVKLPLEVYSVDVPPIGYTKVPRISIIKIRAELPYSANSLQWYYPERFGNNAVRLKQVDLENEQWHWSQWQWLRNDASSTRFSLMEIVAPQSDVEVVTTYIQLGFEHILPRGLDHILFILGLFLLSRHWRPLVWQVTAFTVAHTVTLGLAMNNVVELPSNIVEPLIALSIAYVGIENLFAKSLHKHRLLLVFIFGLIHGLGFASVLSEFGMPESEFLTALISFNVGVELGQLAIIALAFIMLTYWFKGRDNYRCFVIVPVSLLISIVGVVFFFERLELF